MSLCTSCFGSAKIHSKIVSEANVFYVFIFVFSTKHVFVSSVLITFVLGYQPRVQKQLDSILTNSKYNSRVWTLKKCHLGQKYIMFSKACLVTMSVL